jgi:hypothetical protein
MLEGYRVERPILTWSASKMERYECQTTDHKEVSGNQGVHLSWVPLDQEQVAVVLPIVRSRCTRGRSLRPNRPAQHEEQHPAKHRTI